jgi:hypothetical protein
MNGKPIVSAPGRLIDESRNRRLVDGNGMRQRRRKVGRLVGLVLWNGSVWDQKGWTRWDGGLASSVGNSLIGRNSLRGSCRRDSEAKSRRLLLSQRWL